MVPLVVFAFNRPGFLSVVVDAIVAQTVVPPLVFVFVDGARCEGDLVLIEECCRVVLRIPSRVVVVRRGVNFGCAGNIVGGVDEVLRDYERVVVLEDDVVPVSCWYESMCLLLDRYVGDPEVVCVGGFPSLLNGALPGYVFDVVFSSRFSAWGWGTWGSKWGVVSSDLGDYRAGCLGWDPRLLPTEAGFDIPGMIAEYARGELWDGVIVGSFLVRGFRQVISRGYLVRNIGAAKYLSADRLRFMYGNNPLVDMVPERLPDVGEVDFGATMAAVRAYVASM